MSLVGKKLWRSLGVSKSDGNWSRCECWAAYERPSCFCQSKSRLLACTGLEKPDESATLFELMPRTVSQNGSVWGVFLNTVSDITPAREQLVT